MWGPHGAKWRHIHRATSSGRWNRVRRLGGTSRPVGLVRRRRRRIPENPDVQILRGFLTSLVLACLVAFFLGIFAGFAGTDPRLVVAVGLAAGFAFGLNRILRATTTWPAKAYWTLMWIGLTVLLARAMLA
ncbi:MAG: hypothetical protein ACYS0E_07080 [Planctomycetota bacterium]|jgi:hypothetical protein